MMGVILVGLGFAALLAGCYLWRQHTGLRLDWDAPLRDASEASLRRWAGAACGIAFGRREIEGVPESWARLMLARDWSLRSGPPIRLAAEQLLGASSGNVAWDVVRGIVVMRLGVAASLVEDAAFVEYLGRAHRLLRSAYSGWDEVRDAYVAGWEASQVATVRDQDPPSARTWLPVTS